MNDSVVDSVIVTIVMVVFANVIAIAIVSYFYDEVRCYSPYKVMLAIVGEGKPCAT